MNPRYIPRRSPHRPVRLASFAIAALVSALVITAVSVAPEGSTAAAARPKPSGTPTPTPTPTPTGTYTPPASIPADCSVSVTAALTTWLGTVPDFATISFPAGACYRIDEIFTIRQRTGLTFNGNGATFRTVTDGTEAPQPRTRSHWLLLHATDIVIRDLTIDGPNANGFGVPALEAQHGFEIDGGVRITIAGVAIREVYGDGVTVARGVGTKGAPLPPRDSEDVTIADSSLSTIGRQGVSITSARRVTVARSTLTGIQRSAIDLEPVAATNVIEDIVVDSNTMSDYDLYMVAAGGACAMTFRDVTITGNIVTGTGPRLTKLACPHRQDLVIEGNTMTIPDSEGDQGILVAKWSTVLIRNNTLTFEDSVPAVVFAETTGVVTVENNLFCGASAVFVADPLSAPVNASGNDLDC